MRTVELRVGSSGPLVRDLQARLNRRLNPSPCLPTNGVFSPQTESALRLFQACLWLDESGVADRATVDALYETELSAPILHDLPLAEANAATEPVIRALAMLLRTSPAEVRQRSAPAFALEPGGASESGTAERVAFHNALAKALGLTYHPAQSWPVSRLIRLLHAGPVVIDHRQNGARMRPGGGWGYLVLLGLRGSHEPDGMSTTLRLYDPEPPGALRSMLYTQMLRQMDFASFGVFSL